MSLHARARTLALPAAAALVLAAGQALAQPANDLCGNATVLAVGANSSVSVNGTNVAATSDTTSSGCSGVASSRDVWYKVVAPAAGVLTATTCTAATFDTVLSYRSACPGAGGNLACNDDACNNTASSVSFAVAAGQNIWIRVAGFAGASGTFTLQVSHGPPPPPPNPALGPDVTVNQITDVFRWGTDAAGATTAYSVGTDSCNIGDYPVIWVDSSANANYAPDYDVTQHPVINQNMYRLKSYGAYARFEQLGQSWLKHGFLSTNAGACGTCGSTSVWRPSLQSYQVFGSDVLGISCSDTYGASLNGNFSNMGAKNIVNATLGTSPFVRNNGTGDATTKMRLQVPTADVTSQPAGTRFFVDGFYVAADDAQFVRPGQTVAFNALNNASWREISATSLGGNPTFVGLTQQHDPGIFAWKSADASVSLVSADHDDVPNPGTGWRDANGNPSFPGTTIRSRFWVGAKVTPLAGGLYRYEYAVYNHNSDRSAQQFVVPIADSAIVTDFTFHAPSYHSGEPYSNAPWTMTKASNAITFATTSFTVDANANAIRWGTLYNFGFTANVAPVTGSASITLFKPNAAPGAPAAIPVAGLPVPPAPPACLADFNQDGAVDPDDLSDFIGCFFTQPCAAADFNGDTAIDPDDLSDYIGVFFAGC